MQYLNDGFNASEIVCEAVIMAIPSRGKTVEPFRIYEVTTPINGIITIKAHHISYDLDGAVLQPFIKYSLATVLSEINYQLSELGFFNFVIENNGITVSSQFSISYPQSAASVLGQGLHSLVSVYGAEVSYQWNDFDKKEHIILNAARGTLSTATVAYGFNLLSLDSKVNSDAVYSHIYPYAKVTENNVTTLVTLPEERLATGATTTRDRTLLVDLSGMFETAPTVAELRAAANEYLGTIDWNAQNSCSFDFVPLQNTTEYENDTDEQSLSLCDTVLVDASVIGVQRTAKVVRTVYNQITDKYDSMTVGMIEANIADTIAGLSNNDGKSIDAKYLPLSGGTVSGDVDINGDLSVDGLNINGDDFDFGTFSIDANSSVTINFANDTRKMIVLSSAGATGRTILLTNCTSTGTTAYTAMRTASALSYTTGTRTLTISNSSSSKVRGFYITF